MSVDELHLTYLRSSNEWARTVVRSLLYINAGGIFLIITLASAFAGSDGASSESIIKNFGNALIWYTIGVVLPVVSSWMFSWADFSAAWGSAKHHKLYIALASLAILCSLIAFWYASSEALSAVTSVKGGK